ncbi:MAG: hypothetical protein EA384_08960 [Spirochaetaceae bacterium]|nr:MAG: hypothetical protein EA384_08960 [Spirochaetaceae bacterium]
MSRKTNRSPVSLDLRSELLQVQNQQIAADRSEYILKDNCNAAPVRDRTGKIVVAISMSAFEYQMTLSFRTRILPETS